MQDFIKKIFIATCTPQEDMLVNIHPHCIPPLINAGIRDIHLAESTSSNKVFDDSWLTEMRIPNYISNISYM